MTFIVQTRIHLDPTDNEWLYKTHTWFPSYA